MGGRSWRGTLLEAEPRRRSALRLFGPLQQIQTNVLLVAAAAHPGRLGVRLDTAVGDISFVKPHRVGALGAATAVAGRRTNPAASVLAVPIVLCHPPPHRPIALPS